MGAEGWIGVDLDGTLARYDGWQGEEHIGEPIPLMLDRVKGWLAEGREVRIFTARASALQHVDPARERYRRDTAVLAIQVWCERHLGVVLRVTNEKDYGMTELWDDRAVQVVPNMGLRADGVLTP